MASVAKRAFRSPESVTAELATRARVGPLLERHGFTVTGGEWVERGIAITQVIEATRGDGQPIRMHVRLCWRRDGRNPREDLYAAAQLRARLDDDDWDLTLDNIAARHRRDGYTHLLLVQDSAEGFMFAALVPSTEIPAIWARQRVVSDDVIARGLAGNVTKNHAANGKSPTLWLQDDRFPGTPAIAQALWDWPGVVNVLAFPLADDAGPGTDTYDDLAPADQSLGRDGAHRVLSQRSGYPRDPKVRAAVRQRANGRCERGGCGEHRDFPGFLDVHHILGVEVSDRVWTCVALCPNCHREAHYSPDASAINAALFAFAAQFHD